MLTTQIDVVLRVGDERVVLGLEPAQVLEPLQRGLGAADLVQALHERQQRPVERAPLHLVLLGVEVLLGAVRDRLVLERLEARSRCRSDGESVAASTSRASNAGGPPSWRYSWRMSGVFTNTFGR